MRIFYCIKCKKHEFEFDMKDFKRTGVNVRDGWGRPLLLGICPHCGFKYSTVMNGCDDEEWLYYLKNVAETHYKEYLKESDKID